MIDWVLSIGYAGLLVSFLLGLTRFILGPRMLDRILAFDLMAICIIAVVILFSLQTGSTFYLEILLIFGLLGFTTALAFMDSLFRRKKGDRL